MTNNNMNLGIAMVLIVSLSIGLLTIPSGVAMVQPSPQNQTMPVNLTKSTLVIPFDLIQLRNEVRSQYPPLAAISDHIQTMDTKDTLKYTIGVAALLEKHAKELITTNQTSQDERH